ncbi:hypothetical protein Bca4012_026421 [Brassica carinata]
MHMSKTSHPVVPKYQRPPIWTEEADGFHKRVKRIYDPVKLMVPFAMFDAESPIPPDKGVYLSSYIEVLDDQQHVEASQKGLRFIDDVDKGPIEAPSSDISNQKSIDYTTSSYGIRKFRVRSKCFSKPFAKLRALLIAEMIDKGENSMEEAFTQE